MKTASTATPQKVNYHTDEAGRILVFDVLKANPDGTFDIGVDNHLVVGSCRLTETPQPGACTLLKKDAKA